MSLTVTAVLCSPGGYPAPVARNPAPAAQHIDQRGTVSGSAGLTAGVAQVSGGLNRPVGAEELVIDVKGAGTTRLSWDVGSRRREMPGSQEFTFIVEEAASRYCWVEVTARLETVKPTPFFRSPLVPGEAAFETEPLIGKNAAQAGVTLTLHEGDKRFFVGRPLDLPLTVGADGFAVARGRGAATGSIRWADDVGGRAGYTWVQAAPSPVVRVDDLQGPDRTSSPVLIEPGSQLRAPKVMSLTATYDIAQEPEWAVPGTLSSVLEVDVIIDGVVTATRTTQADYVTVGRTHRDICIDSQDVSRSHGAFELRAAGWVYCQHSANAPAQVIRGDSVIAAVGQEGVAAVQPGDVIRLTRRISLALR